MLFNTKFFNVEAKFSLFELGRIQCSWEHLDTYVKRFHDKALACDLIEKEVLVIICLHDILEEYCIFLENMYYFSFSVGSCSSQQHVLGVCVIS